MEFSIHPACALFPMMDADALGELAQDIRANGLKHPVIVHDGVVLDGRNRLEACRMAGVSLRFEEWDGDGDPLVWIISTNLHRRHLTTSQRAMVAAGLATMRQGERTDLAQKCAVSQLAASDLLNVSRRAVQQAAKVAGSGTPGLIDAVSRGPLPVSTAAEAAELPAPAQDRLVEAVTKAATPQEARAAARAILKEEQKPHVAHNSGENEWYTPATYIKAAAETMGRIDLDPASSAKANETVGAAKFYTAEDDGLNQTWNGRVWLNPPYAQPLCSRFAEAVAEKYERGEIAVACVLVNNATETTWFQRMLGVSSAVCFPRGRVRFLDPGGKPSGAPLQGQAVIYIGKEPERFRASFDGFGTILVP